MYHRDADPIFAHAPAREAREHCDPVRGRGRKLLGAVMALAALTAGCGSMQVPEVGPISTERIQSLLASPDRAAADRTNDLRRKPEQLLAFIAPRRNTLALDVSAAGGYTSELLARAIGAGGTVYAQNPPRPAGGPAPAPAAPEGNSNPNLAAPATPPARVTLPDRVRNLAARGDAARLVVVSQPFENPVPAEVADGKLDMVTLMFNYHDMGFLGVDRAAMNRAIYRALRPGGVFIVADHSGRAGTGISESGTLHRVEEAFLRREVEAAGFRLAASGDFLHNPNDPRDRNTPNPPQPKDEFVLKFVKP